LTIDIVDAIERKLKTDLNGKVEKKNIGYGRLPVTTKANTVNFFEVAQADGYQINYDSVTLQFSVWCLDKWDAVEIKDIIHKSYSGFRGTLNTTGGTVEINWTELIDAGALPESDPQLYGQFLRFTFRYRGSNIGGI
jgi:hypothetical protein